MKCPNCVETLLVMADRQGIEIDYCPNCRGVWLDRGELDKLLEKSLALDAPKRTPRDMAASAPRAAYQDAHHQHADYYPRHRKKSWLEDLFD